MSKSSRKRVELVKPSNPRAEAADFEFLTIGHSNIPPDRFIALLQNAGIAAIADVRTTPLSRFCPWFSGKNLAPLLAQNSIGYLPYGAALGGRPQSPALYCDGVADYEAMANEPEFQTGIERLQQIMARSRVSLMCAEREPLDCHRCLLVARRLAERGLTIGHILHDGTIERHAATEQRLLALDGDGGDLFAAGQDERLAAAYRRRARAVAFRQKVSTRRAGTES